MRTALARAMFSTPDMTNTADVDFAHDNTGKYHACYVIPPTSSPYVCIIHAGPSSILYLPEQAMGRL